MSLKLTEAQIQSIILEETERILSEDEADIRRAARRIKQEDYAINKPPFFINTRKQFDYWSVIDKIWIPYLKQSPGISAREFLISDKSKSPELEKWLEGSTFGSDTNSFTEQINLWYWTGGYVGASMSLNAFFGTIPPREARDKFQAAADDFKSLMGAIDLKLLEKDVQALIDAVAATSAPEREKEEKSASFATDYGAYPTEDVKKRGIARFGDEASVAFVEDNVYKFVNRNGLFVYSGTANAFVRQEDVSDVQELFFNKEQEFLKQYPGKVYSGTNVYIRVGVDNTYQGPMNIPGADRKKFELMPDSALNESQKLHEAMVLVGDEGSIPVSAEEGSDEAIPSVPAPEGTPAAAPATTRRRLYYRGETEEVTKIQKALKDLGHDLGSFGPNKDGIDGRFGSATLRAWRKATGLEELPDTAAEAYKAVVGGVETRDQPAVPEKGEEDIRGEIDPQRIAQIDAAVDAAVEAAPKQRVSLDPEQDDFLSNLKLPPAPPTSNQAAMDTHRKLRDLLGQISQLRQTELRDNNTLVALAARLAARNAELQRDAKIPWKELTAQYKKYEIDTKTFPKQKLIKAHDLAIAQLNDLSDKTKANQEEAKKEIRTRTDQYRTLIQAYQANLAGMRESIRLSEEEIQQIILEETTNILKKNLNEAASAMGSLGPKAVGAAKSLGSAAKAAYGATRTAGTVAGGPGRVAGTAMTKGAAKSGLLRLLGFGIFGRIAAWLFGWPVMVGWQVWDEFVAPFTIEAERGDITKTYKQMADSQEASRMREGIDKASGDFLIKVQEYVKGFKGFSLLDLILDITGGPINIITNFNTDLVGYITSKFTDNPMSAAIKKRRVEASRQFYKILQEYGPEVRSSEGNIVPNSPQKMQGLEQALNAKISEFIKQEYDVLATTDMAELIGDSIPTKDEAEAELQAAAKPLIKACLDYYKFIGGAEASQGEEGPAATGPSGSPGVAAGVGAAAGAAAARKVTPKPASYTGRVSELTQKVVDLLKSNGVKDRAQQDAWISWTKEVTKKDKVARDETILDVIEEWFGFTGEKVMRENRHLMEAVGLILPEKGEYEFKDFVEWLEDNNKQSGLPTRYGLHKPRHLRRYLSYVRTFKRNEARAARQDKRSDRINKKVMKNREQILSLQGELESLGDSKKDARKAKRLDTKIKRLTGAAERKEKRAKKVKLRKRDIKNLQEESNKMKIIERDFMSLIEEETQKVVEIAKSSSAERPEDIEFTPISMTPEEEQVLDLPAWAIKLPGTKGYYYYKLSPDGKSYTAFADSGNPRGKPRGTKLGVFNDEGGLAKVRRAAGLHPDPNREEELSATLANLGKDEPDPLEESVKARWQEIIKG